MKFLFCMVSLLLMTLWLVACRGHEPGFSFKEDGATLLLYDKGQIKSETIIKNDDPIIKAIEQLLINKNRKWSSSLISYAPLIFLRGVNYNINIQEARLVLNWSDSFGKWHQQVTEITALEFKSIKSIAFDSR